MRRGGYSVKYAAPVVVDFGSIADHTFVHTNKNGHMVHKDHIVCETDKFGEYSCGSHGGSVGSSG
jgi:hypothetical protein